MKQLTWARGKVYEYAYMEAYSLAADLADDAFHSIDFVVLLACEMH